MAARRLALLFAISLPLYAERADHDNDFNTPGAVARGSTSALGHYEGEVVPGGYTLTREIVSAGGVPAGPAKASGALLQQRLVRSHHASTNLSVDQEREEDQEPGQGGFNFNMHGMDFPSDLGYSNEAYISFSDAVVAFREYWHAVAPVGDSQDGHVIIRFLGATLDSDSQGVQHVTQQTVISSKHAQGLEFMDPFWHRSWLLKLVYGMAKQDKHDCDLSHQIYTDGTTASPKTEVTRRAQRFYRCLLNNFPDDSGSLSDEPIYSVLDINSQYLTLEDYVGKKDLTQPQIASITKQIIEGLLYLFGSNTIHHMLAPSNIFIKHNPESGDVLVKLANLGSAFSPGDQLTRPVSFVRAYAPPELLDRGLMYEPPVSSYDVFGLGNIISFMVMKGDTFDKVWPRDPLRKHPDDGGRAQALANESAFEERLIKANSLWRTFLNNPTAKAFTLSYLRRMIANNATDRPTLNALLETPWLKDALSPEDDTWDPSAKSDTLTDNDELLEFSFKNDERHSLTSNNLLTVGQDHHGTHGGDLLATVPEQRKANLQNKFEAQGMGAWISDNWDPTGECLPLCDECEDRLQEKRPGHDPSQYTRLCRVKDTRIAELTLTGVYSQFHNEGPYPQKPPPLPQVGEVQEHAGGTLDVCNSRSTALPNLLKNGYYTWLCMPVTSEIRKAWEVWMERKKAEAAKPVRQRF
mmetsp:Transcript_5569/g.16507  ORF Transcript_5569/g.16507 Transcript_5569/m.16507 type:complete len:694 (-) Transcript_5569:108-2189(-)